MIIARVTLSWGSVANAAVAMIDVVSLHEARCPGAGRVEVGKAFGRKLRSVLGGAEQRLGIGVMGCTAITSRYSPTRFHEEPLLYGEHPVKLNPNPLI